MTLWNGTPGSYGIPLHVNLTDVVQVTHNVYSIHVVEVPNVTTGTVNIVSAYSVPSVSSNVTKLDVNGLVPPVISAFFNGVNVTQSPSSAVPFPNTTAGELVNITVYAPDAVPEHLRARSWNDVQRDRREPSQRRDDYLGPDSNGTYRERCTDIYPVLHWTTKGRRATGVHTRSFGRDIG